MHKLPRTLARIAAVSAALAPVVALAHPGHDDPDFTWSFSHLVEHPLATLLCFSAIGAGAWVAWRLARRSAGGAPKDSRGQ